MTLNSEKKNRSKLGSILSAAGAGINLLLAGLKILVGFLKKIMMIFTRLREKLSGVVKKSLIRKP